MVGLVHHQKRCRTLSYQIRDREEAPRIDTTDMAPRREDSIVHDDSTSPKYLSQISPIERFFGGYTEFQYDETNPIAEEYQRLRRSYGWKRGDIEGEVAWSGYRLALVKEFNRLFGTDAQDLLAWQSLCIFVGVKENYTTSEDCRRVCLRPYQH